MTTIQKSMLGALGLVAIGVVLYQHQTISRQASEIAALRMSNGALVSRQGERIESKAARVEREVVGVKQSGAREVTEAARKIIATMSDWADRAVRLRELLKASSMWVVPEFRTLQEVDWLDVAKDAKLETEADIQNAFFRMRRAANQRVATLVNEGLKAHAKDKSGILPTSVEELSPFIDSYVNPEMQLNPLSGSSLDIETRQSILRRILESDWFDKTLVRGAEAQRAEPFGLTIDVNNTANTRRRTVAESLTNFNQALIQFQQRSGGHRPTAETQLEPFLNAPMNAALLRMLFEISQGSVK